MFHRKNSLSRNNRKCEVNIGKVEKGGMAGLYYGNDGLSSSVTRGDSLGPFHTANEKRWAIDIIQTV